MCARFCTFPSFCLQECLRELIGLADESVYLKKISRSLSRLATPLTLDYVGRVVPHPENGYKFPCPRRVRVKGLNKLSVSSNSVR